MEDTVIVLKHKIQALICSILMIDWECWGRMLSALCSLTLPENHKPKSVSFLRFSTEIKLYREHQLCCSWTIYVKQDYIGSVILLFIKQATTRNQFSYQIKHKSRYMFILIKNNHSRIVNTKFNQWTPILPIRAACFI